VKVGFWRIMIICITLAAVGWLHASGVGYKIVNIFENPGGVVDDVVPNVDINR
jgi:hypothetical protein